MINATIREPVDCEAEDSLVVAFVRPFSHMLPAWTGKSIEPRDARIEEWAFFIVFALLGVALQAYWLPKMRAKADQLEMKNKRVVLNQNIDINRAPMIFNAMFTALWACYTCLSVTASVVYGLKHGIFFVMLATEGMLGIDLLLSDSLAFNMVYLRRTGFTFWYHMALVRIAAFIGATGYGQVATNHLVGVVPRLDIGVLLAVPALLTCADLAFYPCHRALHRLDFLAGQHVCHHSAKAPGLWTALTFQPLDLAIEFSMPTLVITLLADTVLHDPALLLVTMCCSTTWYGLDHDYFLDLPHVKHHKYISQHYWAYAHLKESDPQNDVVRPLVEKANLRAKKIM